MLDAVGTPVSRFDTSAVKAIKDSISIVDLVSDYVALRRRGRVFVGLCPFHDDHRPSLDVDPDRQRYRCWACGAVGDIFSFVMAMERVSFREALERLAERAGVPLPRSGRRRGETLKEQLYEVLRWATEQFVGALWQAALGEPARRYLEQRGFRPETLKEFRIGFAPNAWSWLADRARAAGLKLELLARAGLLRTRRDGGYYDWFRGRVVFPIFDIQGRVVAFGARIVPEFEDQRTPKYLNSPETPIFSKAATLYGLHSARRDLLALRSSQPRRLLVVEGYTDCLSLVQAGVTGVVGTLGTALTVEHVRLLQRLADTAVLVFDGDAAGQKAAERALGLLAETAFDVRVALLPKGMDPADYVAQRGVEAFWKLVSEALDPLEFRLRQARLQFDLASVAGRRNALDYVLAPLAERKDASSSTEALLVDRIAEALRLSESTVLARLRELRRGGLRAPRRDPAPEATCDSVDPLEKELLALVLVWPQSLALLVDQVPVALVRNSWIRQILELCYRLWQAGEDVSLEHLCWHVDEPEPLQRLQELAELGATLAHQRGPEAWLRDIVERMEERQLDRAAASLHAALGSAAGDEQRERELLERLSRVARARHQRSIRSAKQS